MNLINPVDIEKKSMEIIAEKLAGRDFLPENKPVIMRVIHTTADFDFADNLCFSDKAVEKGLAALRGGCVIVTDTEMAKAGINKAALSKVGARAVCFMADAGVAEEAKQRGITRAAVSMERAAELTGKYIVAAGNAPTALLRLFELIKAGKAKPELVVAVPVGFVNVVESKELIMTAGVPFIAARGRKGGSGVAAAVCNALLYALTREEK